MNYDEQVLHQHAEQLYKQANGIIVATIVKYAFVALFLGLIGAGALQWKASGLDIPVSLIGLFTGVIGGIAGLTEGRRRAFLLKLEAQRILVLAEIERNTRRTPSEIATAPIEEQSHA